MAHIKDYLPASEEELNQILINSFIDPTPFKIGDNVKILNQETENSWTIIDFSVTADEEPAALLENESFHTFALLEGIQHIEKNLKLW